MTTHNAPILDIPRAEFAEASHFMHEQAHELYVEAVLSKRLGEELDLIEGVEVQVVGIHVFICLFIGDHCQLAERGN